jgi:group II intron reverse transcriptase/maturase
MEVSTKQQRIAENAKNLRQVSFTSLAYHLDGRWMYDAYQRTRKDGAVGIDRVTAKTYAGELATNLKDLAERALSGRYYAPAVRRVRIPKPGSTETRPIGIPTFEDKVLQRAVAMLIEPIYEQDFKECSFGFRPGRNQHQALRVLWEGMRSIRGGWVIDLDIRKFFDTLDHSKLRQILDKRVRDGVLRKLIDKWLKAGVMENGIVHFEEAGTPQGGVISPLLSNIYLHEVLDTWFLDQVQPRLKGKSFLVRYADDAVIGFEDKTDALRVMAVLGKRFERYGLSVHPEKTRLLDMRRPVTGEGKNSDGTEPGTFMFLGFRYHWACSNKGYWALFNKTDKSRLSRALGNMKEWLRDNRHIELREQHKAISQKLKGHYAYYGITGNYRSLKQFYTGVVKTWFKWLNNRSRKRDLPWWKFLDYINRCPLPQPKLMHTYAT